MNMTLNSAARVRRPIRIEVRAASATYPVEIAAGGEAALPRLLDDVRAPARRFIVSTAPVWEHHSEAVAA